MLILPTTESANGKERAHRLLSDVARQRVHCSLVVFGNGERAREIASRADVRAESAPFRKTVWIPDPSVLAGHPEFAALLKAVEKQAEVVALSLRFQPVLELRGDQALDFFELEIAFSSALAGRPL